MGATASNAKPVRNSKRGSVDNASRLAALGKTEKSTAGADWGTADARWLAACIAGISAVDGAIMFGYSRDGGAYRVIVYLDGDSAKLWWNGDCDVNIELEALWTYIDGLAGAKP